MAKHEDAEIIERLGGPSKVAEMLGNTSVQRIWNWTVRGIPPKAKLERPDLFLQPKAEPEKAAA